MLPAVRANASLRSLDSLSSWVCEVEPLMRSRAAADAAANDEPPLSRADALVARRRTAYLNGGGSLEHLGSWYCA
jgi:hypothetical protein